MARKKKPYVPRLTNANSLAHVDTRVMGTSEFRFEQAQAAQRSSGEEEPPRPTLVWDEETRTMVPTGAAPRSTGGAGATEAGRAVDAKAAVRDITWQDWMTPDIGKAMLSEAGAYMRAFTSQSQSQPPKPPGWFESQGTTEYTKEIGKTIDDGISGGADWLSNLFDYKDESDLEIAGFNLSAAESTFDAVVRGVDELHNLSMWATSGVYLAANRKYWENRDRGTMPGNLWQDAALIAPGRAQAALESSLGNIPLAPQSIPHSVLNPMVTESQYQTDPDFDITESGEREEMYNREGMSARTGINDAILGVILDPTIGLGKVAKIGKLRFLGGPVRTVDDMTNIATKMDDSHIHLDNIRSTVDEATGEVSQRRIEDLLPDEINSMQNIDEYSRLAYLATSRVETAASKAVRAEIDAIADEAQRAARRADFTPEYVKRVDEDVIFNSQLLKDATNKDAISQALHKAQTFEQAQLLLRHGLGDNAAAQALDAMAPELYMHVVNGERKLIEKMLQSDPSLVAAEVAKWEKVHEVVAKRVDDLVTMKADDAIIGEHRALLNEIEETLEQARNAEVPPVGTGAKPSAMEIDLHRRSIDNQLRDNYLFERAIRDAEGDEHLRGVIRGRKGDSGAARFGDVGNRNPAGLNARASKALGDPLDRIIAVSRQNRAFRRAAVQDNPSLLSAVKTGWSAEFYGIDPKNPIARVMAVPTRVAGVLEAGARYGWVEKPSGLIHTAGITAQESSRELRAVVRSVRMFHDEARQGRDGAGQLLYKDKAGKVTTKAFDSKGAAHAPLMVGGAEHGERIIQSYLDAMLLGSREGRMEARRIIDEFELEMVDAVARYHGIDVEKLTHAHYRINTRLQGIEKEIKKQKYWVEGKETARNYAPWLETHLQNSSFMKNWRQIERAAHRQDLAQQAAAEGASLGTKARWSARAKADFMEELFDTSNGVIQSVWRPLVLARGGYTIRNTAEGLFRASAYLFSLAPVLNAAKQLALSADNVGRRATGSVLRAERVVKKAQGGAGFEDMSRGFNRWRDREVRVATTEREATIRIVNDERSALATDSAAYRQERIGQLELERGRLHQHTNSARDIVARVDAEPFPTDEMLSARAQALAVIDLNEERIASNRLEARDLSQLTGGRTTLDQTERGLMETLDYLENVDIPYRDRQLIALSDPTLASMAHLNQTMAKRRVYGREARHITDTDTMASLMRGRATADAFSPDDPYTALALQNLSADGTVRQTAAMRMNAVTGGMAAFETRYYVNVNPGDATYFDGVATSVNQIMNSDIGQFVIQGRAQGLPDEEIIANVVRYLYSPEGAPVAAFLNEANTIVFGGAFEGLTTKARAAMVTRVAENGPLYAAADAAQDAYRHASSVAGEASWRMPKPRFEGDTGVIPKRAWDGDSFGGYAVSTSGRGKWQVTHPDGTVEDISSKAAARKRARELQTADDDITRAHWSLKEPIEIDGRQFASQADIDAYLDEALQARDKAANALVKAEAKPLTIKSNGARQGVGPAITPERVRAEMMQPDGDLYDAIEYAQEVIRRYGVVTAGDEKLQQYIASIKQLPIGGAHSEKEAGDIMRSFLKGNENLQPIVGNDAIVVGSNQFMAWWHGKTQKVFHAIGTVPEDLLVRAPFYGKIFQQEASDLFDLTAAQNGGRVSMRDVNRIREMSHRRALKETKGWLYTVDRRTAFGDAAERVIPFASAMQNGVTAVGRLIWRDPSIAAIMGMIWQAPDRTGWTTEDGLVSAPIQWVPVEIRETLGLGETLDFDKQSANVLLNGTLDPSAPPHMAMLASELMKNNLLGVTPETPPMLSWMGEAGDAIWNGWKNYHFGAGFGASQEFASWDKMAPPAYSRIVKGIVAGAGSSAAWGNTFSMLRMTDAVKVYAGEKEEVASYAEIAEKTNAVTWARAIAQLLFLPIAPKYPNDARDVGMTEEMRQKAEAAGLGQFATIGDAMRANDDRFYADQARIARLEAQQRAGAVINPEELAPRVMPSEELFGDAVWRAYKTYSKDNVAGLPSTASAAKFVRDNEAFLSDVASDLEPHNMLDVIGMFANNPNDMYSEDPYDPNAHAYFMANQIPGTNEQFIEADDPLAFEKAATVSAGWKVWGKAIDALELDAMRAGVHPPFSPNSPKEQFFYAEKKKIETFVAENYEGWEADKRQRDDKATVVSEVIYKAVRDPQFQKSKAGDPVWRKGGYADIYVTERQIYRDTITAINEDAKANGIWAMDPSREGKSDPWEEQKAAAAERWASVQFGLRKASPSWQAIQDRYIGDDIDPASISLSVQEEAS